jgi:hypothetical protein
MPRDYPRIPRDHEFQFIVIPRRTVETGDVDHVLLTIARLQRELGDARLMGRIELFMEGFDDDPREVYEIPEIRRFVSAIFAAWPAWPFYFHPGIQLPVILACAFDVTSTKRSDSGRVRLQFDDPKFFSVVRAAHKEIACQANLTGVDSSAWKAHFDAFTKCFRFLRRRS